MMTPMPPTPGERLLGAVVRDRIAELGMTLTQVTQMTGIPERTLHNTTRQERPDRMSRYRVRRLARALQLPIGDILATNDGVPDEPPQQPKKDPKGPVRRQDTEDKRTGPKREASERVA